MADEIYNRIEKQLEGNSLALAAVAERFNAYDSEGNPAVVDWIGWETSPQNNGNRNFMLGEERKRPLLFKILQFF